MRTGIEDLRKGEAVAMGMEHIVRFPRGRMPRLSEILRVLAERHFPVQVRMVDGELTMPDEVPSDEWREIRLGTSAGMVTLVRRGQDLTVVTWGNADEAMQRAWNAVAWAVAKAGEGEILGPGGSESPDDFSATHGLQALLKA